MSRNVLTEFQSILLSNSLANEKYIPFYAHRARKILSFKVFSGNKADPDPTLLTPGTGPGKTIRPRGWEIQS